MFRVRVIDAAIEKLSGSRAQKILEGREGQYSFKNRFRTIETKYVRNFEKFLRYAYVKMEITLFMTNLSTIILYCKLFLCNIALLIAINK